jgi:hypothetical protein
MGKQRFILMGRIRAVELEKTFQATTTPNTLHVVLKPPAGNHKCHTTKYD